MTLEELGSDIKDIQTYGNNDSFNGGRKERIQTLFLLENGDLYACGNDNFSRQPFIKKDMDSIELYPTYVTNNVESIKCVNCVYGFHAIIKKYDGTYYFTGSNEYIYLRRWINRIITRQKYSKGT